MPRSYADIYENERLPDVLSDLHFPKAQRHEIRATALQIRANSVACFKFYLSNQSSTYCAHLANQIGLHI